MRLVYWKCACLDDSDAYSIRERTRKKAVEIREQDGRERFGEPVKITVEYRDGFDLMRMCLGEGGAEG